MTPERWASVQAVFLQAQQVAPAERDTFLAGACAEELRSEVRALLAADAEAERDGFLSVPCPARPRADVKGGGEGALVGQRLGPYQVLRRIGGGGMGNVYLALRVDDYRQAVALKVLKCGLDTEELRQRFHGERQILARLQHPNVARLLDGGTTPDGLPFLVMEFIDGEPIRRFVRERRLPLRACLELFHTVCLAVAHAHAQGVIHRDLKPGNILVTPDGLPKLTDFGLAKHLEDDGDLTQTGEVLGTPAYMAPEQAAGQRSLGPWTDVYALGAILYELLTERPPFQGTPRETLEQVLTREPVWPRRLRPGVARDLETICLKCLEKERGRRYPTAADLADDVGRFLRGEPVRARSVGRGERAARWCRRNPKVAGLLAAIGMLALASLVGMTSLWLAAARQRDRAEARERFALRALDDLYTRVAQNRLAHEPRMQELQRDVLRQALAYYEQLLEGNPTDRELRFKTAQAYHFIARAEAHAAREAEAERGFRRQIALLKPLVAEFPDDTNYRFDLFHAYTALGNALGGGGESLARDRALREAYRLVGELVRDHPDEPLYRDALANCSITLGAILGQSGRRDQALAYLEEGLAQARRLVAEFPGKKTPPYYEHNLALASWILSQFALRERRLPEAERRLHESVGIFRRLAGEHPDEWELRVSFAQRRFQHAHILQHLKRTAEAEKAFVESAAVQERLADDFPARPPLRTSAAAMIMGLGRFYHATGRGEEAAAAFDRAFRRMREFARELPQYSSYLAWELVACPDPKRRDPEQALALARQAAAKSDDPTWGVVIGLAEYRRGRWRDAAAALEPAVRSSSRQAEAGLCLAMTRWRQGQCVSAREAYAEALRRMAAEPLPSQEAGHLRAEADATLGNRATILASPASAGPRIR